MVFKERGEKIREGDEEERHLQEYPHAGMTKKALAYRFCFCCELMRWIHQSPAEVEAKYQWVKPRYKSIIVNYSPSKVSEYS